MLGKTDITKIYETVLSIPGMNENVKIVLTIPRRNVLLLSKVIEKGLAVKDADEKSASIFQVMPKQTMEELQLLVSDLLNKAGLTEMNQKLQAL